MSKGDKAVLTALDGKKPLDSTAFWNLAAFSEHGDSLKEVHEVVTTRLRQDSPDADTLELMLMERCCFLYVFMRAREAQIEDFDFDNTYKEMLRMWTTMASDLRKQRLKAEESQHIRAAVVADIARALKDALTDVDPAIAQAVQSKVVSLLAVGS